MFIASLVIVVSLLAHDFAYRITGLDTGEFLHASGHSWVPYQTPLVYISFLVLTLSLLILGMKGRKLLNQKYIKIIIPVQILAYSTLEVGERYLHGFDLTTLNTNNVYLTGITASIILSGIFTLASCFVVQFLQLTTFSAYNLVMETIKHRFIYTTNFNQVIKVSRVGRGPPLL